jgi:hypothetical protein
MNNKLVSRTCVVVVSLLLIGIGSGCTQSNNGSLKVTAQDQKQFSATPSADQKVLMDKMRMQGQGMAQQAAEAQQPGKKN